MPKIKLCDTKSEAWQKTLGKYQALAGKKTGNLGDFFDDFYHKEYESGEYKLVMRTDGSFAGDAGSIELELNIKGYAPPKKEWDSVHTIYYQFDVDHDEDDDDGGIEIVAPGRFSKDPVRAAIAEFIEVLEEGRFDDDYYPARVKIRLSDNFPKDLVKKAFAELKPALPGIYHKMQEQQAYDTASSNRGSKMRNLRDKAVKQWYKEMPLKLGEIVQLDLPGRDSTMMWTITDINGDTITAVNKKGVTQKVPVSKIAYRKDISKDITPDGGRDFR